MTLWRPPGDIAPTADGGGTVRTGDRRCRRMVDGGSTAHDESTRGAGGRVVPLAVTGTIMLLALVPIALLSWIAVPGSLGTDINTVADQAADARPRELAGHIFGILAPTLLISGLGLLVCAAFLASRRVTPMGASQAPPPHPNV